MPDLQRTTKELGRLCEFGIKIGQQKIDSRKKLPMHNRMQNLIALTGINGTALKTSPKARGNLLTRFICEEDFSRRNNRKVFGFAQRSLCFAIKKAHRFNGVAEEFDADRMVKC